MNDNGADGTTGGYEPFDQESESFAAKPMDDIEEPVSAELLDAEKPAEVPTAPEPEPHRVFAGTGISWAFIFGAILTAAIIILAVQNTDPVPVKLYFWEAEAPLIIVMLVTALFVVLIDELIGLIIRRRKRKVLAEREELKRFRAQAESRGFEVE